MNRRKFLAAAAGITSVFSGCISIGGRSASGPTRSPACEKDLDPIRADPLEILPEPVDGFKLSVRPQSITIGGTLTAQLTNTTSEEKGTRPSTVYDIQHNVNGRWESIFQTDQRAWISPQHNHLPGEGFTWNLKMSRQELTVTEPDRGDTERYVCEPLTPGRYRFVYWGVELPDKPESDVDYALAEEFSLVSS